MNSSIFFASFGDTQRVASKSFTRPAMRVVNGDGSKWVIGPMPERPLTMPSQVLARSFPSGETIPIPVTTTRRLDMSDSCKPPRWRHGIANDGGLGRARLRRALAANLLLWDVLLWDVLLWDVLL